MSHTAQIKILQLKKNILSTVRLAGVSFNRGRVEVYYNGEWGTICHHGWDNTDASVVCRQLEIGVSSRSVHYNYYKKGSGFIFLSNVQCSASDRTLAACGHPGVGIIDYCNHNIDAGVICNGMCIEFVYR